MEMAHVVCLDREPYLYINYMKETDDSQRQFIYSTMIEWKKAEIERDCKISYTPQT